jgi:hypothetical protein
VVSPATLDRLRDHADQVERILRDILAAGVASGRLPEQDLDTVVPLVNACLKARDASGPSEASIAATEAFVLRAVGAVSVTQPVG